MPVWLTLNLHGGRAGGLKEQANVYRERGRVMFPPDSASGQTEDSLQRTADVEKYFA